MALEYNFTEIGKRIRMLRKIKHLSQEELIAALHQKIAVNRSTLSAIENGKVKHYDFALLVGLAELFDCEISYLLCEHNECKTKDFQFIHDMTGLSESAINGLVEIKRDTILGDATVTLINSMLEDGQFLADATLAFYQICMIPGGNIATITFYDEDNNLHPASLSSTESDDIKRLLMADLQNIIFSFLKRQL